MTTSKTATIVGSTGHVGNILMNLLLEGNHYDAVRILVRKPVTISHPKLEIKLVNFNDLESIAIAMAGSDAIFCCVGSTKKRTGGDQQKYWQADHDVPVNVARMAKEVSCPRFILLSAIGANANSRIFYLHMKGKTIEDVIAVGLGQTHILMPSVLLGKREEYRAMELVLKKIMVPANYFLMGKLDQYKAIHSKDVAKAMVMASLTNENGIFTYKYADMMRLAKTYH